MITLHEKDLGDVTIIGTERAGILLNKVFYTIKQNKTTSLRIECGYYCICDIFLSQLTLIDIR